MPNKNQTIDETGKTYERLKVITRGPDQLQADEEKYRACWWCECSCGFLCVLVVGKLLRNGTTKSCGCIRKEKARQQQTERNTGRKGRLGGVEDLTGKTYNLLSVVSRAPSTKYPNGTTFATWYCKCNCGNPKLIIRTGNYLRTERVYHNCGCSTQKRQGYEKQNPYEERVKKHIQRLAFYGRVELTGRFAGDSTRTEYTCLLHGKTYSALPMNMQNGRGLRCCRLSQGWDSVSAILNGSVRRTDEPAYIYAFYMRNHSDLIKIGIATDLSIRPDDEYGEIVKHWLVDKRIKAVAVEAVLKENTFSYAEMPDRLKKWAGRTEVRRINADSIIKEVEGLINSYDELGLWDFLLYHYPLAKMQKELIESKLKQVDEMRRKPQAPPQ